MFVGIEGLTPAFHDELVAAGGVRARRRALAVVDPDACRRAVDDAVDTTPRRASPSARDGQARRSRSAGARTCVAPDELDGALAAPRRRVELPIARACIGADASADADPRRDRRPPRAARRSSSTRARSATPSTSRRWSPRSRSWTRDGLRVAIASRLAEPRRSPRRRARRARRRGPPRGRRRAPRREPGVTLVAGRAGARLRQSPPTASRVVTARRRVRPARRTTREPRSKRAKDALLGGVGDFASSRPATTSSTSATASAATTGSRSCVGTLDVDARRRADAEASRSTSCTSSTTAARCTCRCTGSARSSATSAPRATRRGSTSWAASPGRETRSKVSRQVRALAEELLQLYAQRAALPGHAFPPADDDVPRVRGDVPVRGDARSADARSTRCSPTWRRRADGSPGLRRRRLRQDRGRAARDLPRGRWAASRWRCWRRPRCWSSSTSAPSPSASRASRSSVGKLSRFQSKAEQLETVQEARRGQARRRRRHPPPAVARRPLQGPRPARRSTRSSASASPTRSGSRRCAPRSTC